MATVQKYLDVRREKADGKFPVKIRIGNGKKVKLYGTIFSLTVKDFAKVLQGGGNNKILKGIAQDLDVPFRKAETIIKNLEPFSFDVFETRFYQRGNRLDLLFLLKEKAEKLHLLENYNNSNLYKQAGNLLAKFQMEVYKSEELLLSTVNINFLKKFEDWATKITRNDLEGNTVLKYSITTLSMYLIRVRAIFNDAISDQIISANSYPFHTPQNNKGYKIPKAVGNKRALSKDQIIKIFNYTPETKNQEFARDIFIFSYLASGMNCIDIFKLKWSDISENNFSFTRTKTAAKTGGRNRITIDLNNRLLEIIEKHGTPKIPSCNIFNVIPENANELEIQKSVRKAITTINVNLKTIAIRLSINTDISTYFARHSFSTILMNSDAPLALISKQLGHTSLKTTESYLSEFTSEKKIKFMDNLLE